MYCSLKALHLLLCVVAPLPQVPVDASDGDIKKAYRKLSLQVRCCCGAAGAVCLAARGGACCLAGWPAGKGGARCLAGWLRSNAGMCDVMLRCV